MSTVFHSSPATAALANVGRWACVAIALASGPAAAAGEFSVGAGGGASHGRVDCVSSFQCDRSSGFGKVFVGYRAYDAVDVQAVYFGGGNFRGGDTTPLGTPFGGTFKVDGIGLTAGASWTFASAWSVAARAGIADMHARFDDQNPAFPNSSRNTVQPLLGVGIAYALSPQVRIGVDYDVTRFKAYMSRGPLQMLSVAVQFSF